MDLATHYLADVRAQFDKYRTMAERALDQVSEDQFFAVLDAESNSLAVLVRHLAGNMRSRFTDFLTTDGEKPDRHRDTEFEIPPDATRADLMAAWADGWNRVATAIQPLAPDDLLRMVYVRGEGHTVVQALNRQLAHYASHIGQIVLLAKHWAGSDWQTLSIPRGASDAFNAANWGEGARPI